MLASSASPRHNKDGPLQRHQGEDLDRWGRSGDEWTEDGDQWKGKIERVLGLCFILFEAIE